MSHPKEYFYSEAYIENENRLIRERLTLAINSSPEFAAQIAQDESERIKNGRMLRLGDSNPNNAEYVAWIHNMKIKHL